MFNRLSDNVRWLLLVPFFVGSFAITFLAMIVVSDALMAASIMFSLLTYNFNVEILGVFALIAMMILVIGMVAGQTLLLLYYTLMLAPRHKLLFCVLFSLFSALFLIAFPILTRPYVEPVFLGAFGFSPAKYYLLIGVVAGAVAAVWLPKRAEKRKNERRG